VAAVGLWSAGARAETLGRTGDTGKQNGAMCKECHFAFSKLVYLDVAILDKVGLTPAVQPLTPMQQYVFQVSVKFGNNVTFGAGFNLAVDNATTPAKSGTVSLHTGETGVNVINNEATHNAKRASAPNPMDANAETVRWLVDYQPPAVGGGASSTTFPVKLFAAVAKSSAGPPSPPLVNQDVRAFSAVSTGRNTAAAPECGPSTIQGFDPAACGVAFNVATLPCTDADGDTFLPVGCYADVTNGGGDCDDTNPNIHPGATELCNGLDDNCNGSTDEGFTYVTALVPMSTPVQDGGLNAACDDAVDTDMCQHGTVLCSADGSGAVCEGDVPTPEICGNNTDDNCDGRVDETEGILWNGLHYNEACHSVGVAGMCKNGVVRCINQRPGCFGDTPTVEICGNGMDDDCDGQMDNGCPDAGVVMASSSGPGVSSSAAGMSQAGSGAMSSDSTAQSGTTGGGSADDGGNSNCRCSATGNGVAGWLLVGMVLAGRVRRRRA
jgi:uncharacterized protein (TIGR03382 family)